MESWENFAVIVGGAAAALLGLLFIAISIRVNLVAASTELRSRAAQILVLFGAVLVVAILLVVPEQPLPVLGAEFVVLALGLGVGPHVLERLPEHDHRPAAACHSCRCSPRSSAA